MTDTVRNAPYLQNIFRDGQGNGAIDPQDLRDFIVSTLSVATGITAAGTNQATATALTALFNVVTTVPAGTGVVLPTGMRVIVMNRSTNLLAIYPSSGSRLESLSSNAAYLLPPGQDALFMFDPNTPTQGYVSAMLNPAALSSTLPTTSGVIWNDNGLLAIS